MKELKFKIKAPIRASKVAAGYDLFSNENKVIKEYSCEAIKSNIGMKISKGT